MTWLKMANRRVVIGGKKWHDTCYILVSKHAATAVKRGQEAIM